MVHQVSSRLVTLPGDAAILLEIFASTRQPELSALGWPGAEAREFLLIQSRAQQGHYELHHPSAEHRLVLVDGEPAGRLVIQRAEAELQVIDLSLLPRFRGSGVGTRVVMGLLEEADQRRLTVSCHVELSGQGHRFWARLGFLPRSAHGAHVLLERLCETSQV